MNKEAITKALETKDDIIFLRVRSKEWNAAWRGLATRTGDSDFQAENPRSGEVWQYMGSVRKADYWMHDFRHRDHPSNNERLYLRVLASAGWKPVNEKRRKRRRVLH